MDAYLGKSYWNEDEIWSDEDFSAWKELNCKNGKHLFDEVVSLNNHYLFCDACEKMDFNVFQTVEKVSQMDFFISRLGKKGKKDKNEK
jgi:hypothetical protein